MKGSNEEEIHKDRAEMAQSQFKLSDRHLTFGLHDEIQDMSSTPSYPPAQSSGSEQSTSGQLNCPQIKKEFPKENEQGMKTWGRYKPLTVNQTPNIKQEPEIKVEPQEFNNAEQVQGRFMIDITEEVDDSIAQKRPMPRANFLMALHQHHKAVRKSIEKFECPVKSLFVQDDDSSRSISSNTSDPSLELGENDISGFNEYKKQFQSLRSPSIEQQIEDEKRKEEELERRRKIKTDRLCKLSVQLTSEPEPESENKSSPGSEAQSEPKDPPCKAQNETDLKKPAKGKLAITRVAKARVQKAKEIGLAQLLSKKGARKQPTPETEEAQAPGAKGQQKTYRYPPTVLTKKEIRSIFHNDGGFRKGKDSLPPGLVSTEKIKQKAFREMLASIPAAEKSGAREDLSILDEATRTFNPSARSDGQGKWKIIVL
ncbi:hypothetical protein PDIG_47940 [Penicillium digitatum PHI26]|uniref:Uncharacterized protein n=2 Tax=Penicillium digitatum TaxID=36651 RepID=K9FQ13_PEND2|nr:hypothetical protein PDIP_57320 [Penicillium digitatum Pd1]EKV11057.1 hypothetical protein PDIP_57320 [Penicillium digitatum Pd1]EKV11780.1 hypothetical protein PDIG_47940 [Penicillium digitatum PHI26]